LESKQDTSQTFPVLTIEQCRDFVCIGADCEDTCCASWQIPVDVPTLKKWENSSGYPKIKNALTIVSEEDVTASCGAHINANPETNACHFLDPQKLCSLQKEFGHSFLSNTCRKFPREESKIDDICERSFSLSCPEVARKILSPKDGLTLEIIEDNEASGPFFKTIIKDTEDGTGTSSGITSSQRLPLRIFCLRVAQDRRFSTANRVILLGMFADALKKSLDEKGKPIEQVLADFQDFLHSNSTKEIESLFDQMPESIDSKLEFAALLIEIIAPYAKRHKGYFTYFQEWSSAIKGGSHKGFNREKYLQAKNRFRKQNSVEYILENYLFQRIFSSHFPFLNTQPLEQFYIIARNFCAIKEQIISMFDSSETVEPSSIITLIQCFSRNYDHNEELQKKLDQNLHRKNINSLPHYCLLLRE
jgi:lysine-N-methylase